MDSLVHLILTFYYLTLDEHFTRPLSAAPCAWGLNLAFTKRIFLLYSVELLHHKKLQKVYEQTAVRLEQSLTFTHDVPFLH